MIAKKSVMKNASRSRISNLVKYLTKEKSGLERTGIINITNCRSHDLGSAIIEIMTVQRLNTRAKSDKVYHAILSFPEGEILTKKQLMLAEDMFCKNLGYGTHQRISIEHKDTNNQHLHLCINKIHPEKYTIYEPKRDYQKIAKACINIEKSLGLKETNHNKKYKANKEYEIKTGFQSFITFLQKEHLESIKTMKSWDELSAYLAKHDIELRPRGNGMVFIDKGSAVTVKASSVDRSLSKPQLVKKYGHLGQNKEEETKRKPPKIKKEYIEQSFVEILQKEHLESIKTMKSWDELSAYLAKHDIELRPRGNGMVFIDKGSAVTVKASSVDRSLSKPQLIKQFGFLRPKKGKEEDNSKVYKEMPLSGNYKTELYKEYQSKKNKEWEVIRRSVDKEKEKYRKNVNNIYKSLNRKYNIYKFFGVKKMHVKFLMVLHKSIVKYRVQLELQKKDRNIKNIFNKKKIPSWNNWLLEEANNKNRMALSYLRARGGQKQLIENSVLCKNKNRVTFSSYPIKKISSSGTVFYEVNNRTIVKDDGFMVSLLENEKASFNDLKEFLVNIKAKGYTLKGDFALKNKMKRKRSSVQRGPLGR